LYIFGFPSTMYSFTIIISLSPFIPRRGFYTPALFAQLYSLYISHNSNLSVSKHPLHFSSSSSFVHNEQTICFSESCIFLSSLLIPFD
jgi:hypothetical protein